MLLNSYYVYVIYHALCVVTITVIISKQVTNLKLSET